MRYSIQVAFAVVLISLTQTMTPAAAPATRRAHNFARWEKAISAYEKKDKTNPPPQNGIEFIGSSTILKWKTLAKDFPGLPVFNRGFGGSEIVDSTHFADRIIIPYHPKMVFLRAGGNDIHAGRSAEQCADDFKDFVKTVHAKLPDTTIVFIGWCPAPVRWKDRAENKKMNELVADWAKDQPNVKYIEMYDLSVAPGDKPREDLFSPDRLHFNAKGFELMADKVRPYLPQSTR